jgi:hypothetical protein
MVEDRKNINVLSVPTDKFTPEQIRDLQERDKKLGRIRRFLQQGDFTGDVEEDRKLLLEREFYYLDPEENILWYHGHTNLTKKYGFLEWRLVVADSMRALVIHGCHEDPMSGHLGMNKTIARVQKSFYWESLISDVRNWIAACRDCTAKGSNRRIKYGLLKPIQEPTYPGIWWD